MGAVIRAELPPPRVTLSSASPEPPAVEHAAKASILVVEDDPSILLGLSMNLKREGYAVVTAEDGEAGLARLRDGDIDLVLLDVMLPKLNGYEMLRILREEGNATPVLVLSARSDEGDKIRGLDLGAEDYVTKPFSV
ncbi:MAG: response regulator, partial [Myxococcales bacterium]|nr:response regulator [Myxococcales bacterium]